MARQCRSMENNKKAVVIMQEINDGKLRSQGSCFFLEHCCFYSEPSFIYSVVRVYQEIDINLYLLLTFNCKHIIKENQNRRSDKNM